VSIEISDARAAAGRERMMQTGKSWAKSIFIKMLLYAEMGSSYYMWKFVRELKLCRQNGTYIIERPQNSSLEVQ
jgi:hypothetical protein